AGVVGDEHPVPQDQGVYPIDATAQFRDQVVQLSGLGLPLRCRRSKRIRTQTDPALGGHGLTASEHRRRQRLQSGPNAHYSVPSALSGAPRTERSARLTESSITSGSIAALGAATGSVVSGAGASALISATGATVATSCWRGMAAPETAPATQARVAMSAPTCHQV